MPSKLKQLLLIITIFLIALVPRIYQLSETALFTDEVTWLVRGKETILALRALNFSHFQDIWWNDTKQTEAIGIPLVIVNGLFSVLFGSTYLKISFPLLHDFVAARLGVAIVNSLIFIVFYLFAKRLFHPGVALVTTIAFALDPFYLGWSRRIMHDAFLTLFTFSGIYFFLDAYKSKIHIFLSAILSAFGLLTKPQALLVLPTFVAQSLFWKVGLREKVKKLLIAILLFVALSMIFWPTTWTNPGQTLVGYFLNQAHQVSKGHLYFYMGEATASPPAHFYLFQLVTRPPTTIISLAVIAVVIWLIHLFRNIKSFKLSKEFYDTALLITFPILYLLIMSLSSIKLGGRYILPLWPWIYLASGYTLNRIFQLRAFRRLPFLILSILLLTTSAISIIKYWPDTTFFYNELIGGAKNAQKYDSVGLCLGTKEALDYINHCFNGEPSVAVLGCSVGGAPYYYATLTQDYTEADILVAEESFVRLGSDKSALQYLSALEPVYTATKSGVTLSKIYQLNSSFKSKCQ